MQNTVVVRIPGFHPGGQGSVLNVGLLIRLDGVLVNVLATGPKGLGFKPGQGNGLLRAIKVHSTLSFEW
jgi:hypothetical protein